MDILLEWAPTGHMIKLDPAFVVCLPDWTPAGSRNSSPLLQEFTTTKGCYALLHPWGWTLSMYDREQDILRNMPLAPRLAYITLKLCKELILDNSIKTYDIKNSLLQCLHDKQEAGDPRFGMLPHSNSDITPNTSCIPHDLLTKELLGEVQLWINTITEGLHKLCTRKEYYFCMCISQLPIINKCYLAELDRYVQSICTAD